MNRVSETLERIQQLWKALEKVKAGSSEHSALVEKIRVLSAEYESLVDAPKKPPKAK
jgi:hypothetical protein